MPPSSLRPTPKLATPGGWTRHDGAGYTVQVAPAVGEHGTLAFALAFARGLDRRPRTLDPRFLYDAQGSDIFERITETPEYYQTRTEDALLARVAPALREAVGAAAIVELGSGSSTKTRRLLDAFGGEVPRYVPIDISRSALDGACADLAAAYPALGIEGIAASYERALPLVGAVSPFLLTFLGSSIGNFNRAERDQFFDLVATRLRGGDHFLVGIDLVKDPARLEAAYNDAAGHSAAFTLNLFARANRELDAGIPLDALEHVAFYDERFEQIEIYARATRSFDIAIPVLGRHLRIARGEMMRTEISSKYRPQIFAAAAARYGFSVERIDRDAEDLFGLVLLRRRTALGKRDPNVALRVELEALLRRTRLRTYEIISPLVEDHLQRQHDPLMGPLAWDLAHIAAFEALWLGAALATDEQAERVGEGLEPVYDAIVTPRAERGALPLPDRAALAAKLDHVRSTTLGALRTHRLVDSDATRRGRLLDRGAIYRNVAQHEAQHQETMLQAIQLREDLLYTPPSLARPPQLGPRPVGQLVLVPAGPCSIGSDDTSFTYDNERPRHRVELAAFRIETAPVTNGEYAAFIDDGGYVRPELWSDDGRRWLAESHAEGPLHWRIVDGARMAFSFGAAVLLDHDRPVMHVCYWEAEAYARWRSRRLPTEQEWEKAASWDPDRGEGRLYPWGDEHPTFARANLDGRFLEPTPVGTYPAGVSAYGCQQMVGDVWEWTSSSFLPYPGFVAFPYREYSEVFFEQGTSFRVLRGGSWATAPIAVRNTFRNWDYPERRQLFCGFRCAEDA